jgi:hypothetical protein
MTEAAASLLLSITTTATTPVKPVLPLSDVKLPTVAALTAATVFALSPFYNNLV